MSALSEISFDLCFIREHGDEEFGDWGSSLDKELKLLFAPYGGWSVNLKVENGLEIAVVELRGTAPWENEEAGLAYVEDRAGSFFWKYLQGYRLVVEPKVDAGSCRWERKPRKEAGI